MKKIILTALALVTLSAVNAQTKVAKKTSDSKDVSFGLKAGLNVSNFTGDVSDNKSKIGFQVGGFVDIKVSDKFYVQPELIYTSLGAKDDSFGTTISANLDYLAIPVMAKYYVSDEFSLEAGPQIGFLLSAKAKANGNSVDIKDVFQSTDFGINLGVGFDFTENLSAGVRYTVGISNIVKDSGDDKVQNSNLALALAYKF